MTMSLLTINVGSSSLKTALYPSGEGEPILSLSVERIGADRGWLTVRTGDGEADAREIRFADHAAAFSAVADWLRDVGHADEMAVVAHRIVHGGRVFAEPTLLTDEAIAALDQLTPLAPRHMPQALATLAAARADFPDLPHAGVFDTAFHRTMPLAARALAIPRRFAAAGYERYGFHGISYESIVAQLRAGGGLPERLVVAHLGAGSSLCAIRDGRSIETTMGFTPTGGIVMGTRPGDLDPGVVIALARETGGIDAAERILSAESGLLGLSGVSADMRDLEARADTDEAAALALAVFRASVRKAIGALATDLGGLDALVFTGGIGEHSAATRAAVCAPLGFLGVEIDSDANERHSRVISTSAAQTTVLVLPSDENRVLARAAARFAR